MQVSQVRGEEERGLLQHPTPTSRIDRGASEGCDQGAGCCKIPWSYVVRVRRDGVEKTGKVAGRATSTSPRRLVRAASSPTKVPRWLQAAAPSSVAVRPRTAEGKVAHPRRTYNLEMKRFEICDAILLTRSTSSVFASCICTTRGSQTRSRRDYSTVASRCACFRSPLLV